MVDWTALEAKCDQRLHKLSKLPLSVFGRGFASAAYAVSPMLYLAEHMGAPPSAVLQRIGHHVAALVDHRADPLAPPPAARYSLALPRTFSRALTARVESECSLSRSTSLHGR